MAITTGGKPIRTSSTHPLLIGVASGGAVGITFCPGKCADSEYGYRWQRDLDADLEVIQAWGASAVITLVEQHELHTLKVHELGDRVSSLRMKWLHLTIVDVSTPTAEFEKQWRQVLPDLTSILQQGGKVLVHCKAGLGRAGMVAAFLLIEEGVDNAEAIRRVRSVRPGAIETAAQEGYVLAYRRVSGS